MVKKINQDSGSYVANASNFNSNEKTEKYQGIQDDFEKAKEYSDDKVQLAMQTYEMVDKHIRRLDSELAKLESELKEKQISSTGTSGGEDQVKQSKKGRASCNPRKGSFNPKNVIKEELVKNKPLEVVPVPVDLGLSAIATSTDVLDMPVDPNEPTYCVCHQVSYGEMIGCDNTECPIEWFHFGCVSLTSKPKGKWFCPKCTSDRKKK